MPVAAERAGRAHRQGRGGGAASSPPRAGPSELRSGSGALCRGVCVGSCAGPCRRLSALECERLCSHAVVKCRACAARAPASRRSLAACCHAGTGEGCSLQNPRACMHACNVHAGPLLARRISRAGRKTPAAPGRCGLCRRPIRRGTAGTYPASPRPGSCPAVQPSSRRPRRSAGPCLGRRPAPPRRLMRVWTSLSAPAPRHPRRLCCRCCPGSRALGSRGRDRKERAAVRQQR